MAEPIEGILVWQGEGKNRKRLLRWKNKVGEMAMPNRFSDDQLAAELRDNQAVSIDVHLELENGQPRRIRPVGAEWSSPSSLVQAAPVRTIEHNTPLDRQQRNDRYPRPANNQPRQFEMRNVTGDFHNPYNFVPAPPRATTGELADREPSGHDRYHADKFSGKLSVTMTAETPLLLLDSADVSVNGDHKSYPVRKDEKNGLPSISPTAIKGMLRSAYEAVTNSRLSVFHEHDERLAFRGEAKTPIAARVEMHKGNLCFRKFSTAAVIVRYRKHWKGEKDKLEKADTTKTPAIAGRAMKLSSSANLPQFGDPVWVKVSSRIARNGRNIGKKIDDIQIRTIGTPAPTGFIAGWVCVTGANAKDKVYERVFVESPSDKFVPLSDDHKKMWKELIKNYQHIHEEDLRKRQKAGDLPTDYLGDEPGKTAWSRHIYTLAESDLKEEMLCYLLEEQGVIKAILPVMISRRLYQTAPEKLLPKQLHPAYKLPELSPADRVFGWVRQADVEKDKSLSHDEKKKAAYRGQLRVGAVKCLEGKKEDAIEAFATPLPLQILGQPKPQQGRFYVAQNQQGEAQGRGLTNEQAGYQAGKGLRGRKVYPHHKDLPGKYWVNRQDWQNEGPQDLSQAHLNNTHYREYLRPKGLKRKDSQNRSIEGWVKPGTKFSFDIHFINLSKVELGGLIWLLQLGEDHFHRFGGGKPLGFGSVQLSLSGSEILSGEELKARYASLDGDAVGTTTAESCQIAFDDAVKAAYPETNFLEAFKKAAHGFDKPVHYPRTDKAPKAEGESFKWFVENSRTRKDGAQTVVDNGHVLPNLRQDNGLPILRERR